MKFKKIFLLILPIIISSCAKIVSFDTVKEIYYNNKNEFNDLKKIFEENNFSRFIRMENDKNPYFTCNGEKGLNYSISILRNDTDNSFTFNINEGESFNEDLFWKQDYQNIKNSRSGYNDLQTFLLENKVPVIIFNALRDFLRKNKIYGIYNSGKYLIVSFGFQDGLVYYPNNNGVIPAYGSPNEIRIVDESWYYFRSYN